MDVFHSKLSESNDKAADSEDLGAVGVPSGSDELSKLGIQCSPKGSELELPRVVVAQMVQ